MHTTKRIGPTEAAEQFGTSRRTVHSRIKRFGLHPDPDGRYDSAELEKACTTELKPQRADSGLRAALLAEQVNRLSRECTLIETRLDRERRRFISAKHARRIIEAEGALWRSAAASIEWSVRQYARAEIAMGTPTPLCDGARVLPFLDRLTLGVDAALQEAISQALETLGT